MMRIPNDHQVQVPGPRSGVLEALGLKTGQTFSAQIVGQTPDGAAQVQIGNQVIALKLPIKPQVGLILQFQVKAGGANPELVLLTGQPQIATPPTLDADAVLVTVKSPPPQGSPQQQAASSSTPAPSSAIAGAVAKAEAAAARATMPQATVGSGPGVPSASQPPLPAAIQASLQLQAGQIVRAEVLVPLANGQQQIAIGNQVVSAALPNNPAPGTIVQMRAELVDGALRLVPTENAAARPAGATPASTAALQKVIAQTQTNALSNQGSTGALLANLSGGKAQLAELPPSVAAAAERLLANRIDLGKGAPSAELLRDAVGRSGVFMEAALAKGILPTGQQGDMKGLMLLLRNALGNWLGDADGLPLSTNRPHPPQRGATPRGQGADRPTLAEGALARDAARQLLGQTDSALSRVRLFQLASLPDAAGRANPTGAPMEWNLELPLMLGQQMAMAHFQISRDGNPNGGAGERGWQVAFSVNFAKTGEVGAQISLRGRRTGVMLWAESAETAEILEDMLPDLVEALGAQGLETGLVIVRHGAPNEDDPAQPHVDSLL